MQTEDLVLKVHTQGTFYDEDNLLSKPSVAYNNRLLDVFAFGHSLFRKGAVIPIFQNRWVLQFQLTGKTCITTADEKYTLHPGDLFITPPDTPYTYHVPETNEMTKYYLVFHSSPLLEMLLGKEIRHNGLKVTPLSSSAVRVLLEQVRDLFENLVPESVERISVLLYELVYKIRNDIQMATSEGPFYVKLNQATRTLMSQKITLDNLSKSFGMGKFSLIREFHKQTGMSPVAYMISVRHKYARQLLSLRDMSISEIAMCCGYSSVAFFISDFKKHEGITPGQYRMQNNN
ncbi:MAG: AraC family transcriptional regulator [Lentisphaeria bacterium]|nr:AraC family transcriptional regulator [Lentisphaeria bacterium]